MDNTLDKIYAEINTIDDEIINALNARMDLSYEANKHKEEHGLPIYDIDREMEVEDRLENKSNYTNMVTDIYKAIFKYERTLK